MRRCRGWCEEPRRWVVRMGLRLRPTIAAITLLLVCVEPTQIALAAAPRPVDTASYWDVSYWNNTTLSGHAVHTGIDQALDHDWGSGSPGLGVSRDYFSARWTRAIEFDGGTYRFTMVSDDGVRLYVDDDLVIDQWYDHAPTTFVGDVSLNAGRHRLRVEYYERTGLAVARLSWGLVPSSEGSWRATYHANTRLGAGCMPPVPSTDCRAIVADDPAIDFYWGWGAPRVEMPTDRFSVRWSRMVTFEAGWYEFATRTDDGVRLWVDNQLIIDHWYDQPLTSHVATLFVEGQVPVRMEYYENEGVAAANLKWVRLGDAPHQPEPPAGIVVDDTDAGFVKGGSGVDWGTAAEGYGGHLTWTRSSAAVSPDYNWARWYPDLNLGRYEVFVYIPDRYTTTSQARYWVSHRDGFTLRRIDQSAKGGQWLSLGIFQFRGSNQDYVSLADVTFEPNASRLVGFDAVKWVKE
ncbi:MAG: PA14 domain-containing protein [Anaerolineae bacterium]